VGVGYACFPWANPILLHQHLIWGLVGLHLSRNARGTTASRIAKLRRPKAMEMETREERRLLLSPINTSKVGARGGNQWNRIGATHHPSIPPGTTRPRNVRRWHDGKAKVACDPAPRVTRAPVPGATGDARSIAAVRVAVGERACMIWGVFQLDCSPVGETPAQHHSASAPPGSAPSRTSISCEASPAQEIVLYSFPQAFLAFSFCVATHARSRQKRKSKHYLLWRTDTDRDGEFGAARALLRRGRQKVEMINQVRNFHTIRARPQMVDAEFCVRGRRNVL
jgi:hypothetical protein